MYFINRILLQLNKAIECANSKFPQEKELAIILFDNLIEIFLVKKAENTFLWDRTTWLFGSRKFKFQERQNTLRYYKNLLAFSQKTNLITKEDCKILEYIHNIRNYVYHKGTTNDEITIDLAILFYYNFIKQNFINWINSYGLVAGSTLPGYQMIDFGSKLDKNMSILDYKEYFIKSFNEIINKFTTNTDIYVKIEELVTKQISKIENNLVFIKKEIENINFYEVLLRYWYLNDDFEKYFFKGIKPKDINEILLIYAFLRENKEKLDDIQNLKLRQNEGNKRLKEYILEYKHKYPYWINISKIKKKIKILKDNNNDLENIFVKFIEIEKQMKYLYLDLETAISDLDDYLNPEIE